MYDGWAMLAAAVCEQAVDDYRKWYRQYLRADQFEKGAYMNKLKHLKKEMYQHLFWDSTTDNVSFEQAVKMVEKQEDQKWQEEKERRKG